MESTQADPTKEPIQWRNWSRRWMEALGVVFLLAGVVFFFAANWKEMSPFVRLGALQAGVIIAAIAAVVCGVNSDLGRWFLGGATVLAGVLFAVYGQIYQTGADAFEVYAFWAVLTVAWAIVAKFPPLWLLWMVVAETAIILFGGQVVVPNEIAGWSSIFLGLGIFSGLAWLVSEKANATEWFRITLGGAAIFWLTLIPWRWIFVSSHHQESIAVHAIGTLVWLAAVIGIWRYFSREDRFSLIAVSLSILSVAFIIACFLFKFVVEVFDEGVLTFILAAVMAVALFGGSALLITNAHRKHPIKPDDHHPAETSDEEPHWLVKLALGLGAWFGGIFLTGAIGSAVGYSGSNEFSYIVVGLLFVASGVALLHFSRKLFLQQLGLAISLAGHISFFGGVFATAASWEFTPVLIASFILCPVVYFLAKHPVQRFLSVSWVWTFWIADSFEDSSGWQLLFGLLMALAVVIVGLSKFGKSITWFKPAFAASVAGLFGMLTSISSGWDHGEFWMFGHQLTISIAIGLGFAWLIFQQMNTGHSKTKPVWLLALAAALIGIGMVGAPGVAASLGLMIIAHANGDRKLEWFAILSLGGFMIVFYYFLGVSLLAKSLWLIGIGVGALIVRTFIPSKPSNALAS